MIRWLYYVFLGSRNYFVIGEATTVQYMCFWNPVSAGETPNCFVCIGSHPPGTHDDNIVRPHPKDVIIQFGLVKVQFAQLRVCLDTVFCCQNHGPRCMSPTSQKEQDFERLKPYLPELGEKVLGAGGGRARHVFSIYSISRIFRGECTS